MYGLFPPSCSILALTLEFTRDKKKYNRKGFLDALGHRSNLLRILFYVACTGGWNSYSGTYSTGYFGAAVCRIAGPSSRAVWGVCLRPLACWDCGFRISRGSWMSVCCECCMLSGRGLCEELITRPEESYRLWCVVVCVLETSRMRRPWPALGCSAK